MKARHLKEKKGRFSPVLLAVPVLALAIAAAFLLPALSGAGQSPAFRLEEPVRALTLPMTGPSGRSLLSVGPEMDRTQAEAALQTLVDTAAGAGANTLLFQVQAPGCAGVYYKDRSFDPVNGALDVLDTLCDLARQSGLQVYLLAAPFAAAPAPGAGAAAEPGPLAKDRQDTLHRYGDQLWFDPADEQTVQALARSMARLARRYPVAGVILSDFSFSYTAANSDALTAALQVILTRMQAEAADKQLGLAVETGFSAGALPTLQAAGLDFLLAQVPDEDAAARWAAAGLPLLVSRPDGEEAAAGFDSLLRSRYLAGTLGQGGSPLGSGAVLGSLFQAQADPGRVGLQVSYFAPALSVEAPAVSTALALAAPADGARFTADSAVLLGVSDPTLPLTLSTGQTPARAAGGSFTAQVPLEMGENVITLSQPGGESLQVTLTRVAPSSGGGGSTPRPDRSLDESVAGQTVLVTAQLASALSDPHNDDAIAMTLRGGGQIPVLGRTETLRSGRIAGAYLLASGDYLLEANAQLLGPQPTARLAAPTAQRNERGDLTLRMAGGAPVCYDGLQENTLTLTFYGAELGFDPALLCNEFILTASAAPTEEGEGVTLTLTCDAALLWGYDIQYEEDATLLTLRRAPALSRAAGQPLAGVTVLLDPGHGGTDSGAAGIGGSFGLVEKDLNLSLAFAARDRLQQLGATVLMTRSEDSFPTLQDRWDAQQQLMPDFFVAVHHNSISLTRDPAGIRGLQVYYFERLSRTLADSLMASVSAATGRTAEEARWGYFYVTRVTCAPSVLFEFGFLTDPQEFESCASAQGIRAAAEGIAEGIVRAMPAA